MSEKRKHETQIFTSEQDWLLAAIKDVHAKMFDGQFQFGEQAQRFFGLATTEEKFKDAVYSRMTVSVVRVDRKNIGTRLAEFLQKSLTAVKEAT